MQPVFKMTQAEARLAELLWANETMGSMDLVKLAELEFGWNKSTTFTNLKSLINKGLAKNDTSRVSMLYTRDEIVSQQCCRFVDDAFGGSLPMLLASYIRNRVIPHDHIAVLRYLIDKHEKETEIDDYDNSE